MAIINFKTVKAFSQFLWNWKLQGSPLVDQNTANLRAEICASCHNNIETKDVKKGGCGTCQKMGNKVLNQIRDSIISGNRSTSDSKLLACGQCGCDLRMLVWIPNSVVTAPEDINAYPSFCWRKKVVDGMEL